MFGLLVSCVSNGEEKNQFGIRNNYCNSLSRNLFEISKNCIAKIS